MDDRNGNPVNVGDRVYVLPKNVIRAGGTGYVRAFSDNSGSLKACVDDGPAEGRGEDWTWCAWCAPAEFEKI